MWSIRICFIAAVVVGLNSCSRGTNDPPPVGVSSPDVAPAPTPAPPPPAPPVEPLPAAPPEKVVAPSPAIPPVKQVPTPRPAPKGDAPIANTTEPISKTTTPAKAPDAPIPLDLVALEKQLKSTKAIGLFSKIALKNQVDDLMKDFRQHYKGKTPPTMPELRQSYDLLMMKALSLVQDEDKDLAAKIVSSRAAIWDLLADPVKFAALDA